MSGLPLATNVVGGVLRCKSEQEWRSINENWLAEEEGGENISQILKLSFDHLASPSLKKCFAYCSIYAKGKEMEKQQLIELWIAEGFLQPNQRNDMEYVGSKSLNVLLHNSLLLVAKRDECGNVESCMMHDLVHDLASSVSGCSYNTDGSSTPVRYMNILEEESSAIPKEVAKHMRTLFWKGEGEISGDMLSDMECLHNLTLTSYGVRELPNSIRKLIHLRILNISGTSIENLPEWIGELHHLQTLRAHGRSLRKLQSTLKYLINLRHLYLRDDVELPAEIGRLTCLQKLKHSRVGDNKGCQIEELGSLKKLKGKLVIHNLEKVLDKEEAKKANMFLKSNLLNLRFEWDDRGEGERNDESVSEGLQPHANLKKLGIRGFKGKRFPLWTQQFNNLIEMKLSECHECEEIPMLEHFPSLKYLYLRELKKVGRFVNSSFNNNQNLSKLAIRGCPKLRELPDGLDTLTSLKILTIRKCPNLKSMGNPSGGGGQSKRILRRLWINGCGELMELPRQILELWAPSLVFLSLQRLSNLKNLPMVIDCLAKLAHLRELSIFGVPKLMATGNVEIWRFGGLDKLHVDVSVEWSRESSVGIEKAVDGILQGCCISLTYLHLKGMENWECLPEPIQYLTALGWLELGNIGVEELPQWFANLSSLQNLYIRKCTRLRCLNALERLTRLRYLFIYDCPKLSIDSEWCKMAPHLSIEVDGRLLD